jgi:predicted nucleic acid-binding protein
VLLELLAGARDEHQAHDLRRLLGRCHSLPLDEPSHHEAAAALHLGRRRQGATIRRLPDGLIATVATRTDTALLHHDSDFDVIARHAPLGVVSLHPEAPRL